MPVVLGLCLYATPAAARPITVKGSDTMVILGQQWAEHFMKEHQEARVQITGGGSGTGISALINGTTDICQSSRSIKESEIQKLREKYGTEVEEIAVAKDGLAVYVHASSAIESLSVEQIRGIYTGKITNWREVGGPDARIISYSRENNSGTYVFFKEFVLNHADFTPRTQTLPGTASVVHAVSKDRNSIGYGGAAYARGIRILKVRPDADSEAVPPDEAFIRDGSYPLARPLFFYLREAPEGELKRFIDWILSSSGQSIVTRVGYFPIGG